MEPNLTGEAAKQQLDGRLVLAGIVEMHIHLDKLVILERCRCEQGTLKEAIAEVASNSGFLNSSSIVPVQAGRGAIDPDLRVYLECVPLDAHLELLIAAVGKPDRTIREEYPRRRDPQRERGMVASAESATDIGKLSVDAAAS
jgi:hypothetical protein